jgi:PAS domain S-box-containing protein
MALLDQTWIEEAGKDSRELLKAQNGVLELIARGEPLPNVLDALLRIIEGLNPGLLASVLLLDRDGVHVRHGAAPSLPKSYLDAINGLAIGPCAGSCGTAAYRGEPVIVEDIATDPLWDNYRDIALRHGLRACWSMPIFDEEHRVLGTFALYFRSTGMPTDHHKRQIAMVTHTASIAIMRDRERESLVTMNKRLTLAMAAGQIAIWERDLRTNRFLWSSQLATLLGRSEEDQIETFDQLINALHKDDRPRVLKEIEQGIRERSSYDIESRVVWPDGSVHWLAARGKPYFAADNQPEYIRCAGLDITQRKRVQEEIKQREIQLGDAQRVAHFGSYEWRPDTNTVLWTDELFRIFGLQLDELTPTF